jgi:hypothetical protein
MNRVARRLAQRLDQGEPAPWFPGATIHDWGVAIPNGWGGKKEIPWKELGEPEIVRGFCRLHVVGKKAPVATAYTGQTNFFPGLELVQARRTASKV